LATATGAVGPPADRPIDDDAERGQAMADAALNNHSLRVWHLCIGLRLGPVKLITFTLCRRPPGPHPEGAQRRAGICGVAAPRRCHPSACVAAPCICPPGARAKVQTLFLDRPLPPGSGPAGNQTSSSAAAYCAIGGRWSSTALLWTTISRSRGEAWSKVHKEAFRYRPATRTVGLLSRN